MRLPEFLTTLSPVGETLAAVEAGEALLRAAVDEKNRQVCIETADSGLSLWEADYSLDTPSGADAEHRRAAVRAAIAGGRTLTPDYLRELCVTLTGADAGEVEEDFENRTVTAVPVKSGAIPGTDALETSLERLKPAHLRVEVQPCAALSSLRCSALTGGVFMEIWCGD